MNEPQYANEYPMNPASLATLEKGLREGARLHAFRSGGGLRVVRLDMPGDIPKGYGEHYAVEVAIDHTAEDYLAGVRLYNEVYGEDALYPHYLTGSSAPNSPLDLWLLKGSTFDAYVDKDEFVFELKGYEDTQHPPGVMERARAGETVLWENRGYTYESKLSNFRGGSGGVSTSIVKSPEGKRSGSDPWMYRITKTGRASTLTQALDAAFLAPSVESADQS